MLANLQILTFKEIDKRLNTFVESHNNLNTELSTSIRISRKSALRNLVNAYRNYIFDYRNNKDWESITTIPEMPMRRKTISKMVGCCEKTSYNHLSFLVKAGVFVKQLHGRQNDFGLFLNPYFWVSECQKLPNITFGSKTQTPVFSLSLGSFLPPISIQKIQERNNYYNKDVETVDKLAWNTSQTNQPQFQRNNESDFCSRKSNPLKEKGLETIISTPVKVQESDLGVSGILSTKFCTDFEKTLTDTKNKSNAVESVGGSQSLRTSEVPPQILLPSDDELEAWSLVNKFSKYAIENIYLSGEFNKNAYFSESQLTEIRNLIMSDVFGNFKNATTDGWRIRQKYTEAVIAIDKAIAYARKHKWSSFLPAKCYFSKSFGKKGTFFDVLKWNLEDKFKLDELKKSEYLEKAKHHVRCEIAPRGKKELNTRLQISSYFKHMVAKRCGAMYVSQFNVFLANGL